MKAETPICKLCLEPVSNFLCSDCLFEDVKKWLVLKQNQQLFPKVWAKHDSIKSITHLDTNGSMCVKCKSGVGEIACPCCYLYEMFSILKETNEELAYQFEKHFNFDFNLHHAYSQLTLWQSLHDEPVSSRAFSPILIAEKRSSTDINICENCGQLSDRIMEYNGSYVCESCLEENKIELFRPFSIDFQ